MINNERKKSIYLILAVVLLGFSILFSTISYTITYFYSGKDTSTNNSYYIMQVGSQNVKVNKQYLGMGKGDSLDYGYNIPAVAPDGYIINTINKTLNLNTAQALAYFKSRINDYGDSFDGYTVNLNTNITLNEQNSWVPIGFNSTNLSRYFSGTFNGNGHVIYNLTITDNWDYEQYGLFGYLQNATILNLGVFINNVNLNSTSNIKFGGIAGHIQNTTIDNCFVRGNNTNTTANISTSEILYAGGIVGHISQDNATYINNVSNSFSDLNFYVKNTSSTSSSLQSVGGLVGYMLGANITNCYAVNNITTSYSNTSSNNASAGGLVGRILTTSISTISDCFTANTFINSPNGRTGDIVGYSTFATNNCYASVDTKFNYKGNFNYNSATLINPSNFEDVTFFNNASNWSVGSWRATTSVDNLTDISYQYFINSAIGFNFPVGTIFVGDVYYELDDGMPYTIDSLNQTIVNPDTFYALNIIVRNYDSAPVYFRFKVFYSLDGVVKTDGLSLTIGSEIDDNGFTNTFNKDNDGWYVYQSNSSGNFIDSTIADDKTMNMFTGFTLSYDALKDYDDAVFNLYIVCEADTSNFS